MILMVLSILYNYFNLKMIKINKNDMFNCKHYKFYDDIKLLYPNFVSKEIDSKVSTNVGVSDHILNLYWILNGD